MVKHPGDYVIVGRLGKPFGVHGWLKLQSFTHPIDNIFSYTPWFIEQNNSIQEVALEAAKEHANSLLVKLTHCDDRDQAAVLTNKHIIIEHNQLPALKTNEFYWSDLIGFSVINQQNEFFGCVDELFNSGANDVLVVKGTRDYLIPFIWQHYIINVNKKERQIIVDWHSDD